ncbi:MAG: hypothetical protein ACKO9F_16155, partial [Caldilinea sp.]
HRTEHRTERCAPCRAVSADGRGAPQRRETSANEQVHRHPPPHPAHRLAAHRLAARSHRRHRVSPSDAFSTAGQHPGRLPPAALCAALADLEAHGIVRPVDRLGLRFWAAAAAHFPAPPQPPNSLAS